jgi:hypothetical protein
MNRRNFLLGALAAPVVICTPGLLMPVKSVVMSAHDWPNFSNPHNLNNKLMYEYLRAKLRHTTGIDRKICDALVIVQPCVDIRA